MQKSTITLLIAFTLFTSLVNAAIQRVRIDFTAPDGYTRHLLLGFTTNNAATDAFDYGYDALNIDNFPNDLNWMIENDRYVIQGVGAFDYMKTYRLGMFLRDSGNIQIRLDSLENFDEEIPVYVYDSLLQTFTQINDFNFGIEISEGEYLNRFYITFTNSENLNIETNALSTNEITSSELSLVHYKSTNNLEVKGNQELTYIDRITLYDLSGKQVYSKSIRDTRVSLEETNLSGILIAQVVTESDQVLSKLITL